MQETVQDIMSDAWEPLIAYALRDDDDQEPSEPFDEEPYDPLEYDPW